MMPAANLFWLAWGAGMSGLAASHRRGGQRVAAALASSLAFAAIGAALLL